MYSNNSTLREIYKLTFKLENSFHEVNRTLRQLMAKNIIYRNDGPQEENGNHTEDQQQELLIKRWKKKRARKEFSSSNQGGSASVALEDEFSIRRQKIDKKSYSQLEHQRNQMFKRKNRLMKPFHMFYKQQRSQLLTQIPELSASEVSKIVLERWRRLSQQEKQSYVEKEESNSSEDGQCKQTRAESEVKEII